MGSLFGSPNFPDNLNFFHVSDLVFVEAQQKHHPHGYQSLGCGR